MSTAPLVDITPFISGIDAQNLMRADNIQTMKDALAVVEKEISRCTESGPGLASLCRDRSRLRKSIFAMGGRL